MSLKPAASLSDEINAHRPLKLPWKSWIPIVPKITRVNEKSTKMFNICGSELSSVITSPRIPGTEFIVRKGLKILTTRIELTFDPPPSSNRVSQPRMTTKKSSYRWCDTINE